MVVEHMIAASVVMLVPVVAGSVARVPDVRKLRHCGGFPAIQFFQKPWVNRAAVIVHPAPVKV